MHDLAAIARGIKSKSWTTASGRLVGGKPFSRGALYLILQNRLASSSSFISRTALPFASGSFDFISCQYAFHHFRDKAGMLRETFRVLRRGGPFALYNMCPQESDDWLYYAYLYSVGTGEPHDAGLVRGLARGRFIIGDKASVYAEIARYREPSNAAAELGLRRFAHGKPGCAPLSGGYDDTAKLAQPAARVLDPHRILPIV